MSKTQQSVSSYFKGIASSRFFLQAAALAANLIFYLSFILLDGPVICVDSQSYIDMDYSREPVYPLFLAMLRRIFGTAPTKYGTEEVRYLVAAVVIQAVVMAFCVWFFARGVSRAALANPAASRCDFVWQVVLNCICWGVDLLSRFAALRGSMYAECIMTESLAIPLFLVFLTCAYRYFLDHRRADLLWCALLIFTLLSIRKQMAVSALLLAGFAFFYELLLHRRWKPFLACVLAAGLSFGGAALFDYSCNYCLRGVWMHKTHNYKGADCTLLYTAEPSDAALFDDPEMKELFEKIYSTCEESGWTYDSIPADSDWYTRSEHFAGAYDEIGFEVMLPALREHVLEQNPDIDDVHLALSIDNYMKELQSGLVHQNLSRYGRVLAANLLAGIASTVLRKTPGLWEISFVLFGIYVLLWVALLAGSCRSSIRGRMKSLRAVELFAALVLVSILLNCFSAGAMIFPQSRYMIYNMAPFYCAGLLMLGEIFHEFHKSGKN